VFRQGRKVITGKTGVVSVISNTLEKKWRARGFLRCYQKNSCLSIFDENLTLI
jgi:hypothetical protein